MCSQPAHFQWQCRAREREPGEATTCTLSDGHGLGASRDQALLRSVCARAART